MPAKEKVVKNTHTLRKVCSALGLEYDPILRWVLLSFSRGGDRL